VPYEHYRQFTLWNRHNLGLSQSTSREQVLVETATPPSSELPWNHQSRCWVDGLVMSLWPITHRWVHSC